MNFFRQIALKLMDQGHRVRVISVEHVPSKKTADTWEYFQSDWTAFDWQHIESYDPDRVVIFNGMFRELYAASLVLKKKYNTFFAEVAWFPQNDYIYIDNSIHHKSYIGDLGLHRKTELSSNHKQMLADLQKQYRAKLTNHYPEFDILIPLQLEYDTSILYASDYFKSMKSLIGFVKKTAGNASIVVKTHPKNDNDHPRYKNMFSSTNISLIDKCKEMGVEVVSNVSIYELINKAKLIVGINSTSLMEALIFHKPVLQFGNNVAHSLGSGCCLSEHYYLGIDNTCEHALEDVKANKAVNFSVDRIDLTLLHLMANQIDFRNPPQWAVDKILNVNNLVLPRTMEDIA